MVEQPQYLRALAASSPGPERGHRDGRPDDSGPPRVDRGATDLEGPTRTARDDAGEDDAERSGAPSVATHALRDPREPRPGAGW
jgi:hypothetical protein